MRGSNVLLTSTMDNHGGVCQKHLEDGLLPITKDVQLHCHDLFIFANSVTPFRLAVDLVC